MPWEGVITKVENSKQVNGKRTGPHAAMIIDTSAFE